MSAAVSTQYLNSVLKMFTNCSNTTRHSWTRVIDPKANCSSSSFCQETCSYQFSPKSLLAKFQNMYFVLITQFIHHKNSDEHQ